VTINGNFYSSGTLLFEFAGIESGMFDVLNVNRNAFFDVGTMQFDFINGFMPSIGDEWDCLVGSSVSFLNSPQVLFSGLGAWPIARVLHV